jgi:Calcineurin-like phosphoesterase
MLLLSSVSLLIVASLTILFSIGINSLQVYADPTYRIAATGDISCSSNAQNTVNQIKNQNPNLVLWLGDLSYNDANIDCFISQTSQLASRDEAVIGNHDDSEDGSSAARTQTINYFGLPSSGYYSKTFDVAGTQRTDDILLVGMDTQSSYHLIEFTICVC